MGTLEQNKKEYKGVLGGFKMRLQNNRLGELLLLDGFITQDELSSALSVSKSNGQTLGQTLVSQKVVEQCVIRQTLVEQFMLRLMMAFLTIFISFAGMAGGAKNARAASIKDVPARVAFQQAAAIAPMSAYPRLFGSSEKQSSSLTAFTKWTSMFERFDAALNTQNGNEAMSKFKSQLEPLRGQSFEKMVVGVNAVVNRIPYIGDNKVYGMSDYWATPIEFVQRGGDCEDFAITKYVALRALGVPEERMRILVLQDLQKNVPHAILVVYTENGPMLLDNQIKAAVPASSVAHYKPIFSINRDGWWLHTKPKRDVTVVASAAR